MRKKHKNTTPSKKQRAVPGPKVKIPDASYKLLEYIESIGTTRSSFNLLRSSESRLKIAPPHLYHL
jgi:hypothetical protein